MTNRNDNRKKIMKAKRNKKVYIKKSNFITKTLGLNYMSKAGKKSKRKED